MVPRQRKKPKKKANSGGKGNTSLVTQSEEDRLAPSTRAQRLKRVFLIDITQCLCCGGAMRIIADITDPAVMQKISSI
jgi:hypothetical protein